jgi:MerR family transcriptional regulator, light-induced transcriptional regulator
MAHVLAIEKAGKDLLLITQRRNPMAGIGRGGVRPECKLETEDANVERSLLSRFEQSAAARMRARDGKLARTIEGEIIPRLVVALRAVPSGSAVPRGEGRCSPEDVEEFVRLVVTHDGDVAHSFVEALRTRGVSLEKVFLDLLSPTARRLSEMWQSDECDFTTVTIALLRLHHVLREYSPAFQNEAEYRPAGWRALLMPSTAEQHTFGLFMVGEFLRRDGWDVCEARASSCEEVARRVRAEWFDLVGISANSQTHLDTLAVHIAALRKASRNPEIRVMVGGNIFIERPEWVAQCGADATAVDGRQAVLEARRLVRGRARPR